MGVNGWVKKSPPLPSVKGLQYGDEDICSLKTGPKMTEIIMFPCRKCLESGFLCCFLKGGKEVEDEEYSCYSVLASF